MADVIQEQWLFAQQAVIGDVLVDEEKVNLVLSQTRAGDYTGVYREIYLIFQELMQAGKTIDPVVVLHRMKNRDGSGRKLIAELIDLTPTAANCQPHIDALVEQAKLHHVRELSMRMLECQSVDEAQEMAMKMSELLAVRAKQESYNMAQLLEEFYERHTAAKHPVQYLTWGLKKLDYILFIEPGDFVILGGYPSDGKTAMALSMAWHQSRQSKIGFFSLETRAYKLFDRQVAMITGIPMPRIKRNQMTDGDWKRIAEDGRTIYGRSMDIIPAAGMSAAEVMMYAKARGYEVIYIDYIQLLRPDNPRTPRYEAVSQMSMVLHTLANQYRITVVGLSQLRRPDQGQNRPSPKMSDLRESGQLEQDADVILLLYRDFPQNLTIPDRTLKVAKNKEGEARDAIGLHFDGATQRFSPRPDKRPMKQRVKEAEKELGFERAQMSVLDGPDEDMPFV